VSAARPKVGLIGLFGRGNLGNDASLEVMLGHLRDAHPGATISIRCSAPAVVAERFGVRASRVHWYEPKPNGAARFPALVTRALGTVLGMVVDAFGTAAWVRRQDVVIVPGMGVLEATLPLRPWRTPYLMFLTCVSARIFGTRTALVSVGANVIRQRWSRWLVVRAARSADYLSFRDVGSRAAMREMGVDVHDAPVYPDLAFALAVPRVASPVAGAVGVGVMDYSGDNNDRRRAPAIRAHYTETMTRFVLWLVDQRRTVRLLIGDSQDVAVVDRVIEDVRAQRPGLAPTALAAGPASSLAELMQQLTSVDTVVATRYHTALCALKLDKPTVAVGYAAKFDSLMADAGLAAFSLPAKSVDLDVLIDRFTELEGRSGVTEPIEERNVENRRLLEKQFCEMSAALFGEASPSETPRYYSKEFWSHENLKYVEPHFRMLKCAHIVTRLAQDRTCSLLDVGCGPATLQRLLPPTVGYHGIDIAIHSQDPNLVEADIVKDPITFDGETFDIVVAQGFFEYVGEFQSRKFDEIAELLAPGGTFVVSYVNFDHRRRDRYSRYSNVQTIADFRRDLSRNFVIRESFPTSYNWSHHEPNRRLVRAANLHLNVDVPLLAPRLAVQYLFICSHRPPASAA
jgi:polysaccharide pyruvyl transferase WcaK-like protein/SAM-dependent methyltransferase